jgi:2-dehydro-3-deoxy-L-rhamnonate dehydrogenase (NAD+)
LKFPFLKEKKFENQSTVITGGADGIGKAIARRLADEGAEVTIFDLNETSIRATIAEFAEAGLSLHGEIVNIAEETDVITGFEAVAARSKGGHLDIMINCAAIVGPTNRKITEISTAEFDLETAVNLRGTFLMTKHAIVAMERGNYGRVLNFASIAGKEGNAGMSPYSSTKAGVIGLVKSVGKEYAETGITVNAIAAAVIRTPMVDGIHPDQVKYMTDKIPMKRCGSLDEIAALSCWIVSREASFSTGFTFDLSGGRAVY